MSGETMGGENLRSVDPQPVDPHLNTLTCTLFRSLHQASGKFAMFGHQNETSNVIGPNTDSDVHAVTGTYPALWGSDLSGVERDETTNIDGFSMGDVRDELLRAYTMGAVTTMSWHSANPITFGGYGHNMAPGSVAAVLPGGARHGQFLEWLDAWPRSWTRWWTASAANPCRSYSARSTSTPATGSGGAPGHPRNPPTPRRNNSSPCGA